MAATLREVADVAGVSPSTVSRVVRGVPFVSDDARKRVQRAIETTGYRPNTAARTIRTGVSHAVGFVVPDISNWFYSAVFRGAQQLLYESGYELMLATSDGDPAREVRAIDSLLSRRIDALILSLADEHSPHLASQIDLPTVLLDREAPTLRADSILSDHASGMRSAVSYLVDMGHERIALLTGKEGLYTSRSRLGPFRETLATRGINPADCVERVGDRSVEAGEKNTLELMTQNDPPTAIIAGSNQLLQGVLRTLKRLEISFPEAVSIIACDDSDVCQLYRPGISVIARDVPAMGAEAARALLRRLEPSDSSMTEATFSGDGHDEPTRSLLPTQFVLRSSTGPPPRR